MMVRPGLRADIFELKALVESRHGQHSPFLALMPDGSMPDFAAAQGAKRLHVWHDRLIAGFLISGSEGPVYRIEAMGADYAHRHTDLPNRIVAFAEAEAHDEKCHWIAVPDTPAWATVRGFLHSQGYHTASDAAPTAGHKLLEISNREKPYRTSAV